MPSGHRLRCGVARNETASSSTLCPPPGSGAPQDGRRASSMLRGAERIDAHPREQGAVDLEGGVLRRRADQRQQAFLYGRQQGVLLSLVEAVDLVEEEDRLRPAPYRDGERPARSPPGPPRGRPETALSSSYAAPDPRCNYSCQRRLSATPAGRRGASSGGGPARSPCAAPSRPPEGGPGRRNPRARLGEHEAASRGVERRPVPAPPVASLLIAEQGVHRGEYRFRGQS